VDEDDDGVCSADLEAEAELEAEYTFESSVYSVVHANQEAHFYNSSFTQGANEADGAGPASSDEEETGDTGL
jgi:hypothetical protein